MKKEVVKYFGLADYLEEERFLADQHRSGWKMVGSKKWGWVYIFEKCEPENYIYQIDFKENGQADDDYLQLFDDCGWEYFHKLNGWYYFRKEKTEVEEENSIFNDAPSRAEMAKKIMSYQWAVILPTLIMLFVMTSHFSISRGSFLSTLFMIFYLFVAGLAIGLAVRTFFKLNKIISMNTSI